MALQQMAMQPSPLGELFVSMHTINGPNPYATGGSAISFNNFALQTGKMVLGGVSESGTYKATGRSVPGPGAATVKIVWFVVATGAEVANGTDLSAEKVRLLAFGN